MRRDGTLTQIGSINVPGSVGGEGIAALLPDAVEGYCDLETGECITPPLPEDDKSVTTDPPPVTTSSRASSAERQG
jgi:hypothetical protein